MNRRLFFSILMLGGISIGAMAQTLTLQECVDKALVHNKSISSAKLRWEQTRFDMKSYKAILL